MSDEERIALFLDYENLALGARDHLGGMSFDLRPISDALAERGRVVVRRAYADWSYFDEDRRMLTRSHVELIEIPQRMGASRKNAADIKMVVDAIESAFVRDYISTFVIATGDSDFTPLVHKLRELNKRVIGVGVRQSTSALLPPACDEFLYYDDLEGVEPLAAAAGRSGPGRSSSSSGRAARKAAGQGARSGEASGTGPRDHPAQVEAEEPRVGEQTEPRVGEREDEGDTPSAQADFAVLVAQTVAGLERSHGGEVTASVLKRTLLRKDPTFDESTYGFRAFGELLRHLADRGVIELGDGPAKGDPAVSLPEQGDREAAFALLRTVVTELSRDGSPVDLSGLKDQIRRHQPGFTEKTLGYRSFLQFSKAAETAGVIGLERDGEGYFVTLG